MWPFSKAKERTQQDDSGCAHPVTHQVAVHGNSDDPRQVTAFKCTQCGASLAS